VTKFVENFFPKIGEFQKKPRHPKWIEANLAATLPGWKRFDAAEEWLTKNHVQPISNERGQFEAYLAARATPTATAANAFAPEERNRLFEEFLEWKQTRGRR
jgi:hypothetical protein